MNSNKNIEKNIENEKISNLYTDIKIIIEKSKEQVFKQVNSILTMTYQNIGKMIQENVIIDTRAKYGAELIKKLGNKLSIEFGNGFSSSNLTRMIKFFDYFNEQKTIVTLSQQFSWSHFVEFIKIKNELKREFYITICNNEKWAVRTLRERINSMLFERTAISKQGEEVIKNDLDLLKKENRMTTNTFLRDPYLLDFLELGSSYNENDLENAILSEIKKIILEFGSDFAFMSDRKEFKSATMIISQI